MSGTSLAPLARVLWRLLDDERIDPAVVFRQAQLDPGLMDQPRARYRIERLIAAWGRAAELIDNPCFGLRAADHWQPTDLHALGYAFIASSTLRSALQRLCRYVAVLDDSIGFTLEDEVAQGQTCGRLTFVDRHPDRLGLAAPEEDATWALIVSLCRFCDGDDLAAAEVRIIHPEPACKADYYQLFRCPIQFDQAQSAILFASTDLDRPLPAANRELAHGNDRILSEFLVTLSGDDLVSRVKAALIDELPSGAPSEQRIARTLNLSTRTLQRRLASDDTRFSELLDTVRRELAEQYINDPGRSLAEISYLLGFSELSAFSRAFKRWTGESPSRYRKPAT